ncbi:MAG: glutamate synthase central domain-containing protein, partial [Pseudomonadota bacterium]|nr:glutamate synthase central domain-containing protein [Pseudomonadota bacterium]
MSLKLKNKYRFGFPEKKGLYDPQFEKDSCGVGLVANIKGVPSRKIMDDAFNVNSKMDHRGGCGFEENTGDGAGILVALPDKFFRAEAKKLGIKLPNFGSYAVGNIFLPVDEEQKQLCIKITESVIYDEGQECLGWRDVPVDADKADVGPASRKAQPTIKQIFIKSGADIEQDEFNRKLYLIRKQISHKIRGNDELSEAKLFYVCSLSNSVIVYKGMLTPAQLFPFYPDLENKDFETHLAMVHSRFSTNTFPSWDRAQPNRYMCHNGEINTLKGNMNAMKARQGTVSSDLFGDDINKLFPITELDCTDSGSFDNVLEFLILSGRSLQESVMMMIPEAWQSDKNMSQQKKAFYQFSSSMIEPWDGPASIVFTDGRKVGAVLDRNGLRPSRYYLTEDNTVIMASEVGVLPIKPEKVIKKGRLQPGKMFLIDFDKGKMIPDEEIKSEIVEQSPYELWNDKIVELETLKTKEDTTSVREDLIARMRAFGYTTETMQFMLMPLVSELRDPLGSMGNDAALACLSDKPRLLYDYFKQLFAQVTNPAIDSIREEVIMSLECLIGPEGNLLENDENNVRRLKITNPILSNAELNSIKNISIGTWKTKTIDLTFEARSGLEGMKQRLKEICIEAEDAIKDSYSFIILSDKNISKSDMVLSSLLACSTIHHHLVENQLRTKIGIVIETGEAREVHHHCLLFGYGADAVNPYLAYESLFQSLKDGSLKDKNLPDESSIISAYKTGTKKGILKVMAKMGISTLHSYKGAQIFEAVGLSNEIIDESFPGTASRVEGITFEALFDEQKRRHYLGYPEEELNVSTLPNPGDFHWRNGGDAHMWDPKTISSLQLAARTNNEDAYWAFAKHANEVSTKQSSLRGLLKFKSKNDPISLDEVESEKEIVKRFATGAMSLGSISTESHESLAIAMNQLGGKSNTGEGGEDPIRFKPDESGISKRSAIKQVASGRFGVTM